MSLPLPNLDDRRWVDLVEEGRALIPLYAPGWTDHNAHDPGITLIELLAWIAEQDLYQINRIPVAHRRKFLALAGITPLPPQPAQTVLSLSPNPGTDPQEVPATTEFSSSTPSGEVRFRTLFPITPIAAQLRGLQIQTPQGFRDLSARLQFTEPIPLWGDDPQPGHILYLGFNQPLPVDVPISLWIALTGTGTDDTERQRILQFTQAQTTTCRPTPTLLTCPPALTPSPQPPAPSPQPPIHPSVQTTWEFFSDRHWEPLDPTTDQLQDDTRSLTLTGQIQVKLPKAPTITAIGAIAQPLYYLRCRLTAGAYDAAPILHQIVINGVKAEQAIPVVSSLAIAPDVEIQGEVPANGTSASFRLQINARSELTQIEFLPPAPNLPAFRVLRLQPNFTLEAAYLGTATGEPLQERTLPVAPLVVASLQLWTQEQGQWHRWTLRPDWDASGRRDRHFLFDPTTGAIQFGDGERGRVPPAEALIFAMCDSTLAEAGNLTSGLTWQIAPSAHNRALLPNLDELQANLSAITNPLPATGGSAAETLPQTAARALRSLDKPQRAVTLADYETLAMETPGVRLARVTARANLDPGFPCISATGVVTVVVLPFLPGDRPFPSRALRQQVAAYLSQRRIIGTRVIVAAPTYIEISVRATVQAHPGKNLTQVQQQVIQALNQFFHPLHGGPNGKGWPFGRDVYRSEVLHIIDQTPGISHVLSLELLTHGTPQCSNLCLPPLGLIAAQPHQITIL